MKLDQLLRPLTRRTKRQLISSARRAVPQAMETLEKRQLMSAGLTIDIEVASTGGKTATVTSVGQTVNLNVIATVTGSQSGSHQGFDSVAGSIITSLSDGAYSVGGDLGNASPTDEFYANGAQGANIVDLNGDGYLDAGSNNNSDIAGFFNARAGGIVNNGTISGDSNSFLVGTLTYTVDTLSYGQATDINFRLRNGISAGAFDAVWEQDGVGENDSNGTVIMGAPVVITDGALTPPPDGSIAGVVSGTSAGVSRALSGVTMFLNTNGSSTYASGDATVTTNSSGQYDFTGIRAGTYYVGEELPSGYKLTTPSSQPLKVTINTSQNLSGQDFIDAGTGAISGAITKVVNGATSAFSGVTVYVDTNNSGSLQSGEPSTTTDSNGNYSFSSLAAGTYDIREVVPSGYAQTSGGSPDAVTLSAGGTVSGQNFTDTSTAVFPGSISGTVSQVVSGTTSAELGVTLFLDLGDTGSFVSGDPTAVTGATGAYSFTGLQPGTYLLREVVPSGYKQTSPANTPTLLTVSSGQNISGQNFTNTAGSVAATGSISGTVSKVVNGVTSADSGVTVYLDTNDNGTLNSGESSTTTTSSGAFSFTGLSAGTYYLREVVPTNYKQTSPGSSPTTIKLSAGQSVTGQNFVDTSTTVSYIPASIAGTVYNDKNSNGKLDSGEAGLSGVEMYIDLNKDGAIDSGDPTTTTSSSGAYSFTGLAPGTYRVREVVPSGDKLTNPTVGYYDIVVQSNWQITGENWGNAVPAVTGTGSISGEVFSDVNGTGNLVSPDLGIPGVTVYLDLKNDGKDDSGDPTTTTSSTGTYSFKGLTPGTYVIRPVVPSGDSFTAATNRTVSVASGASVTGENFGLTGPLSLPGSVVNASGTGLSGWVVYCDLNHNGVFVASDNNKTTASNGTFDFVSLKAGTYTIRVVAKTGYTLTSPASGYYTVVLQPGLPVTGITFAEEPTAGTAATIAATPAALIATTSTASTATTTGATSLSGTVFADPTGTGVQATRKQGLAGWVVYADLKDTGSFVAGDNNKTTLSNGSFDFVSLKPGTYTIRVVPQAGYTETLPNDGYYTVTLAPGVPVSIAFGEHLS